MPSLRILRVAVFSSLLASAGWVAAQPGEPAAPDSPEQARAAEPVATVASAATFETEVDALLGRSGGLTADAAAARAAKASPEVRRKVAEVAVAYARAKQTELVRVPRVSLSAQYARLSDAPKGSIPGFDISTLSPSILNTYSFDASVSVPLSDYLLTFPSLLKAAAQGESAARFAQQATVIEVEHSARVAYYEWVRAKLQVLVAGQLVTQVQASLVRMQSLSEVRAVTRADLLRVQAQAASVRQTEAQLKSVASLRESQLRIYINAPASEELTIGEDVRAVLASFTPPSIDEMLATSAQRRLDIKTIDAGIEGKSLQASSSKASRYPKLSAFGAVAYSDPNQRVFPTRDQFDFTWSVGLRLSWTVNDFLSAGTDFEAVDAEAEQLRADRDRLLQGLRLELESASADHALAISQREVTAEGLAAAEEGYRLRQELLALQRATAVEVIDAETELTRARFAAIDAQIDERVARLRLRHATGEDVP